VPLLETEQFVQHKPALEGSSGLWAAQALLEVGYSFEEVFSVYDKVFLEKVKENCMVFTE
jgi:hypothetical protein